MMTSENKQKLIGLFWEHRDDRYDMNTLPKFVIELSKLFDSSHNIDTTQLLLSSNEFDGNLVEMMKQNFGFETPLLDGTGNENILTQILFWLWENAKNPQNTGSPSCLAVVTNSFTTISLLKKFKTKGVYVVLFSDLTEDDLKREAINSSNALVDLNELVDRNLNVSNEEAPSMEAIAREIVTFSSAEDEVLFDAVIASGSADFDKSQYLPSSQPAVVIPSGIPATWSEHLQQQRQQGAKPTPSLPSLVSRNENPLQNVYYDPHSGKPIYSVNSRAPPPAQYPPTYGQPLSPHEIASPSTIDIAASGGFWSTLQKQPMQQQQQQQPPRWGGEDPNVGNAAPTETLTKEQRVLHDDLVTAIYAYNVNAAVSTLRKMYTKQTRTFRIPTVLGILLPDTAAMIVDGRTDLLNVAVCFALDSIQWCFGVQKGENIESFKYKMNANIARWILHETVKKGIPTTPTPVIQEATISVVNHILENVVELEFAWEMLTTLNISHPVQRIVPHVLAWRGYPNPSIEARVNDFLYDHPEVGTIIPPSNPGPNMHMPTHQPPMQFRSGGGGVASPNNPSTSIPPGGDRTSHMVQAFLRDQRHHPGMDYSLPNQPPNQMPPDGLEDPMMDHNLMKLMGRPQPSDMAPRMTPHYRDEFGDPMRLRGMEGAPGGRMKGPNPPPNAQNGMRGRFPGDNSAPPHAMDYPLNDEYPMHHHSFSSQPRGDEMYGRPGGAPQPSNAPRDFHGRGGGSSFSSANHPFDQDYQDNIPLEGEDYLGSLGRGAPDDERSYMFGQQNFDFAIPKDS